MSASVEQATSSTPANARQWLETDGVHIDVRGLPPPEPLIAILALVESIRDATPIIVHHERDPQLLYPELAELGWIAERIDAPPGEVRLRLVAVEARPDDPDAAMGKGTRRPAGREQV